MKYLVRNNTVLEIQKQLLKWRESGHIWKITGQPSRQIVPFFAARISASFAYMEASVDESGTAKNLPKLQRVISVSFPHWAFLLADLA